jgi:hypothetical protein
VLIKIIENYMKENSMKITHDEKIAKMTFASVYPHYLNKVEKKGRTKKNYGQEWNWLTGYDNDAIQKQIDNKEVRRVF